MGVIAQLSSTTVNWIFDASCKDGSGIPDEKLANQYRRDIAKMLMELPASTYEGDSWKAFMFTARQEQWAGEETTMKLIQLGLLIGYIEKVDLDSSQVRGIPFGEYPHYKVTLQERTSNAHS